MTNNEIFIWGHGKNGSTDGMRLTYCVWDKRRTGSQKRRAGTEPEPSWNRAGTEPRLTFARLCSGLLAFARLLDAGRGAEMLMAKTKRLKNGQGTNTKTSPVFAFGAIQKSTDGRQIRTQYPRAW